MLHLENLPSFTPFRSLIQMSSETTENTVQWTQNIQEECDKMYKKYLVN